MQIDKRVNPQRYENTQLGESHERSLPLPIDAQTDTVGQQSLYNPTSSPYDGVKVHLCTDADQKEKA